MPDPQHSYRVKSKMETPLSAFPVALFISALTNEKVVEKGGDVNFLYIGLFYAVLSLVCILLINYSKKVKGLCRNKGRNQY